MLPSYFDRNFFLRSHIRSILLLGYTWSGLRKPTRLLKKMWDDIPSRVGRDAVVIAGGPSFTVDLCDCLIRNRSRFDVFVLNFYCKNQKSNELVPDYYILSDPAHLVTENNEIIKSNALLLRYLNDFSNIKLITPYGVGWEKYGDVAFRFDDSEALISNNIDPRFPRGYPSNTLFKTLAIALAMRYDRIYILGLDYDYPRNIYLNESNELFLRNTHHYGEVLIPLTSFKDVAHALNWWSYDYYHFRKLSHKSVYNVTDNSLIDFFYRVSVDQFIRQLYV